MFMYIFLVYPWAAEFSRRRRIFCVSRISAGKKFGLAENNIIWSPPKKIRRPIITTKVLVTVTAVFDSPTSKRRRMRLELLQPILDVSERFGISWRLQEMPNLSETSNTADGNEQLLIKETADYYNTSTKCCVLTVKMHCCFGMTVLSASLFLVDWLQCILAPVHHPFL